MSLEQALRRAQTLLTQLQQQSDETNKVLLDELSEELTTIKKLVAEPAASSTKSRLPQLDNASGCYRFAEDPGYYCPLCFDQRQLRVITQRINSRLRICTQCRTSLKPSR